MHSALSEQVVSEVEPRSESKGFTLIELLVVLSIIALLVMLIIPRLGDFNKSQNLSLAASQLQSDLRKTQSNAMSGIKCAADTVAKYWYLQFNSDLISYKIASLCNGSQVVASSIRLPDDVTVSKITFSTPPPGSTCTLGYLDSGFANSVASGSATFDNVTGKAYFRGYTNCSNQDYVKVAIELRRISDINQTVTVVVEKGGAIYVQ